MSSASSAGSDPQGGTDISGGQPVERTGPTQGVASLAGALAPARSVSEVHEALASATRAAFESVSFAAVWELGPLEPTLVAQSGRPPVKLRVALTSKAPLPEDHPVRRAAASGQCIGVADSGSGAFVPILARGAPPAVLGVFGGGAARLSPATLDLVSALAVARSEVAQARRRADSEALVARTAVEISRLCATAPDRATLYESLGDLVVTAFECVHVAVWERTADDCGACLVLDAGVVTRGLTEGDVRPWAALGPVGRVYTDEEVVDVRADSPSAEPFAAAAQDAGASGVVAVPVRFGSSVVAVLEVYPHARLASTPERVVNLTHVAAALGGALERLHAAEGAARALAAAEARAGENTALVTREQRHRRSLEERVDAMLEVVSSVARGDLTRSVPAQGDDALSRLGAGVQQLIESLRCSLRSVEESASELAVVADALATAGEHVDRNAAQTSARATEMRQAADEVSRGVQTVAAASDELNESIRAIAGNAAGVAGIASRAVDAAGRASGQVERLGASGAAIGKVTALIHSIAQQTNLLALNATIEAARAGEAGKGFAVVAQEVKALARQTASATDEIGRRIEAIQSDTVGAASVISEIADVVREIHGIQAKIAGAVEEQSATTSTIGQCVTEAARGAADIAEGMASLVDTAQRTNVATGQAMESVRRVAATSVSLEQALTAFHLGGGSGAPPA